MDSFPPCSDSGTQVLSILKLSPPLAMEPFLFCWYTRKERNKDSLWEAWEQCTSPLFNSMGQNSVLWPQEDTENMDSKSASSLCHWASRWFLITKKQ